MPCEILGYFNVTNLNLIIKLQRFIINFLYTMMFHEDILYAAGHGYLVDRYLSIIC